MLVKYLPVSHIPGIYLLTEAPINLALIIFFSFSSFSFWKVEDHHKIDLPVSPRTSQPTRPGPLAAEQKVRPNSREGG